MSIPWIIKNVVMFRQYEFIAEIKNGILFMAHSDVTVYINLYSSMQKQTYTYREQKVSLCAEIWKLLCQVTRISCIFTAV